MYIHVCMWIHMYMCTYSLFLCWSILQDAAGLLKAIHEQYPAFFVDGKRGCVCFYIKIHTCTCMYVHVQWSSLPLSLSLLGTSCDSECFVCSSELWGHQTMVYSTIQRIVINTCMLWTCIYIYMYSMCGKKGYMFPISETRLLFSFITANDWHFRYWLPFDLKTAISNKRQC